MGLAVWRDLSLLWLISLTLIAVLPLGVILFFAVKGLNRLRQLLRQYLPIAQEKGRLVAGTTDRISLRVAAPIIGTRAKTAQATGVANAIWTRRKKI